MAKMVNVTVKAYFAAGEHSFSPGDTAKFEEGAAKALQDVGLLEIIKGKGGSADGPKDND
jgi:hypothetical protein